MDPHEAAAILRTMADRNEAAIGDVAALDYDTKKLLESSGDLDVVVALRLGAEALAGVDVAREALGVPVSR